MLASRFGPARSMRRSAGYGRFGFRPSSGSSVADGACDETAKDEVRRGIRSRRLDAFGGVAALRTWRRPRDSDPTVGGWEAPRRPVPSPCRLVAKRMESPAWERLTLFKRRHDRTANAAKCTEIAAHVAQARQYFASAADEVDLVRPLLLSYRVLTLSKALILIPGHPPQGNGTCAGARGRGDRLGPRPLRAGVGQSRPPRTLDAVPKGDLHG